MTSREELAHLARDWDAQAAQLERSAGRRSATSETLRQCAQQLRERLAGDGAEMYWAYACPRHPDHPVTITIPQN